MGFGRLAGIRRFLGVPSSRSRGRGSTVRLARARLSIGRRVLRPCPSPPGRRVGTVESRGGFNRRLALRLKIREVRILTDVGDDRIGEEAGEVAVATLPLTEASGAGIAAEATDAEHAKRIRSRRRGRVPMVEA